MSRRAVAAGLALTLAAFAGAGVASVVNAGQLTGKQVQGVCRTVDYYGAAYSIEALQDFGPAEDMTEARRLVRAAVEEHCPELAPRLAGV